MFNAEGLFLTEVADSEGPTRIAVDGEGNLYVFDYGLEPSISKVVRYKPTVYNPGAGEIAYGGLPVLVVELQTGNSLTGIAVNPANDHLFVNRSLDVAEYSSAAEGNELLDVFGKGATTSRGMGMAVDAAHGLVYAGAEREELTGLEDVIQVFELSSPHALVRTLEGSMTPAGHFGNSVSVAADEGTGHVFLLDGRNTEAVYELTEDGKYVSTIEHSIEVAPGNTIEIDNGSHSPNGGLNPDGRYLFVPSNPSGVGHSFAFGPQPPEEAPKVEAVSFEAVGESEAKLLARINPSHLPTSYTFEYITQQRYEEEGGSFAGAQVAGTGQIPAGGAGVQVSVSVTGLTPGTAYRFRVVAENSLGEDEGEGSFSTYPANPLAACPNDSLRTGASALLPDCRAYELVTPPDTNARAPLGAGGLGTYFATREASPAGDKLSFKIEGGLIPGFEGTGTLAGDPYLATRGENGWGTSSAGPTGAEAQHPLPGSTSPDQGYSFWSASGGSAELEGKLTTYVRYPDGHSALVGRGSIGTDVQAEGKLISEGGSHIVFISAVQLEENAPPSGTKTIYDRTSDEVTHVVSLLPGDETPAGEGAFYEGASLDGKGVAFSVGKKLYLRYNDEETYEIGEGVTFAGIAEGGARLFYLKGGNLYRFDAQSGETTTFSTSGDVTVVNVSADGSAAYFVSPSKLGGENPNSAEAIPGQENLYLSREGAIEFVGTVTEEDVVEGETGIALGLWVPHVASYGEAGEDPSRATSDGSIFLFESRAKLTAYDPEGHVEVYRYDSPGKELACLSCNPTGAPTTGNASLQSVGGFQGDPEPLSPFDFVSNLAPDGRRVFFQSTEPLVSRDTDELQDIYEWEAQGVGSCNRPEGCVYLISSGHSARTNYLYAVDENGNNVFFRTADLLLPVDAEETPSIYDARVGGGFAEASEEECQGEGCREELSPPPVLPAPAEPVTGADDNVHHHRHLCPKGKRKVRRHGKVRCVARHHHRAGTKKKGAGK